MKMETKFIHSIKVPIQYSKTAKVLKQIFEEHASVKGLIYKEKHAKTTRMHALIVKISQNKKELDRLIAESKIFENEPRLEKYLGLVLITELLFGVGQLNGDSKPVQCVRKYEQTFRDLLAESSGNSAAATDTSKADGSTTGPLHRHKDYAKPRYVRVNTNLLSRSEAMEIFIKDGWIEIPASDFETYDRFLEVVRNLGDYDFVSDIHVKNLFVFPASSKHFWARNPLVLQSKLILQDKASCLPTILLNPPRGSIVLDMCAAPGMKTTHLASHMKNKGSIYAVERDNRRYGTLCEIVANTKSSIVQPILQDALTLDHHGVPGVEYILVDPSCSGSGMTNRLFAMPEENQSDRLILLSGLQARMLQHAMKFFYQAKKIVYSTCSIYPEENEQVVKKCLDACPDWELVKPPDFAEKWKHFGSPKWKHVGKKCFYAKSDVDLTDGFFVALFERRVDVTETEVYHDPDRDFLQQIRRNFEPPAKESDSESIDDQLAPKMESAELAVKTEPTSIGKDVIVPIMGEPSQIDLNRNTSSGMIEGTVQKKSKQTKEAMSISKVNELIEQFVEKQPAKKNKKHKKEREHEQTLNATKGIPIKEKKKKKSRDGVEKEPQILVLQPEKTKKRKHEMEQPLEIALQETSADIKKKKKQKKDTNV